MRLISKPDDMVFRVLIPDILGLVAGRFSYEPPRQAKQFPSWSLEEVNGSATDLNHVAAGLSVTLGADALEGTSNPDRDAKRQQRQSQTADEPTAEHSAYCRMRWGMRQPWRGGKKRVELKSGFSGFVLDRVCALHGLAESRGCSAEAGRMPALRGKLKLELRAGGMPAIRVRTRP